MTKKHLKECEEMRANGELKSATIVAIRDNKSRHKPIYKQFDRLVFINKGGEKSFLGRGKKIQKKINKGRGNESRSN